MKRQPNEKALYILEKSPYSENEQMVLHVTNEFQSGYICFHDTNRGHMIKGEIVECKFDSFSVLDEHKRVWEFKEVSIEDFNQELYKTVVGGKEIKQQCNTTEELWEYFRTQFPL